MIPQVFPIQTPLCWFSTVLRLTYIKHLVPHYGSHWPRYPYARRVRRKANEQLGPI
jgi:hypothetical protein